MADFTDEVRVIIRVLEFVGTFAGAISGVRLASVKRFDWFGASVIGVVTAVGGGTLRDVLMQLKPFWKSAFKLAIGMSFKSGIAAEVIGQPLHTIGNGLYLSKVYLETAELFSWTIVVVFIAFVCEKIVGFLVDRI